MARSRKEDVKSKGERQQVILRLVQEHPISRQEVLLDHLFQRGIRGNTSHRFPRYPGAVFGKSCHGRGVSLCLQPERKLQPQNAGKV